MNYYDKRKTMDEEIQRQILIHFYPEKYLNSRLADRPDIQNPYESIGVEITSIMEERIHKELKEKDEVGFIGTINDIEVAFDRKIKSIKKKGFKRFKENNLYFKTIYFKKEDKKHIKNYIKNCPKSKIFDYIYIYHNLKLTTINTKTLNEESFILSEDELENIIKKVENSFKNL